LSLYEALARKTRRPSDGEDIWRRLQERLNPANYRPQRDPDVESFMVADPGRPPYEVLKQARALSYLRLNPEEQFLWNLMDGSRAVKDLIIAHFTQFGALAFGRIGGFVSYLQQRWFLSDRPANLFSAVTRRLTARHPLVVWQRAMSYALGRVFVIRGVDGFVDRLYRAGGRVLYSSPLLVLYVLVCAPPVLIWTAVSKDPRLMYRAGGAGLVASIPPLVVVTPSMEGSSFPPRHPGMTTKSLSHWLRVATAHRTQRSS